MIWIVPMAGKGTRTSALGDFKPFININRKPIIYWMLRSIKNKFSSDDSLVFITTKKYERSYDVKNHLERIMKSLSIIIPFDLIISPTTPQGPAASVYLAKKYFSNDQSVAIVNSDQYVDFDKFSLSPNSGYLPVYAEFGNKSSYVHLDDAGLITQIVEKQNISNIASAGVYLLSSGKDLMLALEDQVEKKDTYKDEYYVGPALNSLIKKGYSLLPLPVRVKYDLGSLAGINVFKNNPISMI